MNSRRKTQVSRLAQCLKDGDDAAYVAEELAQVAAAENRSYLKYKTEAKDTSREADYRAEQKAYALNSSKCIVILEDLVQKLNSGSVTGVAAALNKMVTSQQPTAAPAKATPAAEPLTGSGYRVVTPTEWNNRVVVGDRAVLRRN